MPDLPGGLRVKRHTSKIQSIAWEDESLMDMRYLGILSVVIGSLVASSYAIAQAPAEPTPVYTGNAGGGFALTNGNTDTRNFNLTGAFVRDPKTRNVIKGTANYFRGTQSDILNLDRASVNLRDEYTISNRSFVFGQLDYLRDQFKQIQFFWAPSLLEISVEEQIRS
jgi:hypothetical protein